MERHDLEKEASEVSSVGAFGMPPAPTQSLTLEVDQAALNEDLRPEEPEDPDQVRIAVYSSAGGD